MYRVMLTNTQMFVFGIERYNAFISLRLKVEKEKIAKCSWSLNAC